MADYYVGSDGKVTKKKKKDDSHAYTVNSKGEVTKNTPSAKKQTDDIAPIKKKTTVSTAINAPSSAAVEIAPTITSHNSMTMGVYGQSNKKKTDVKKTDNKKVKFFKGSKNFEDGYQLGDVADTAVATVADLGISAVKGALGVVEGLGDAVAYGAAWIPDILGADKAAEYMRDKVAKPNIVEDVFAPVVGYVKPYSVFDRTMDSTVQAMGQMGLIVATAGAMAGAGVPSTTAGNATMAMLGGSSVGHGTTEAYLIGEETGQEISDEQAFMYGVGKGAIDTATEMMFGGIGRGINALGFNRGISSLDDAFAMKLSSMMTNQLAKNGVEFGVKAMAEGSEEVIAGLGSAVLKKLTIMKDEDLEKLIEDENLLEQFVSATLSTAALQSGYVPGMNSGSLRDSNKQGKDYITGYTQQEQAVIDKVYEDAVKEKEIDGKKLTKRDKNKIYDDVLKKLEKGYIDTETIESVLGGETYNSLKSATENEIKLQKEYDSMKAEYDTLNKMKQMEMTGEQTERKEELKNQLEKLKENLKNSNKTQIRSQLDSEMLKIVEGTKLSESYNERARRGQDLEVDIESYKNENAKQTAQNLKDFGVNNTNAAHDYLDFVTKVSEARKHTFKFMTTKQLEEAVKKGEYKIEGDVSKVEAFVDGATKEIIINMDSNKSLSSLVGHEITHTLEADRTLYEAMQKPLFELAKARGEYDARWESIQRRYSKEKGYTEEEQIRELTSDLVGDYIFGDSDFIKNLSTENPNVFKKIYNEIKYLWKMATAGSREARELEKAKKAFEAAWREAKQNDNEEIKLSTAEDGTEIKTDRASEVQFSLANDTQYMDNAIAKNNSSLMVDSKLMEDAKNIREKIAARMNEIKDRGLVGLPEDIEGNTFISNSSYGGTEENTTICPRSLSAEAFVDAVSEMVGRPLTVEEQIYLSQDLQKRSLTPECTYCYVATDRKAYRSFLGEYVSQRDEVLDKLKENPNMDFSTLRKDFLALKNDAKAELSPVGEVLKEFLNGRKPTEPMYKRFKMWVDAYQKGTPMIDASHLANMSKLVGDINSEFGAELKPQITDAMKYAQSASWAKKRVNYVAYNGHILKWKQDRINKLNNHYGLRMYSFSDFHPAFTLENMQMITDASVRGLKMLGYTKDTDFVEIFAPSGMNINISTFGFVKDGVIAENNLIGAEWKKAQELREQYPNVGITFVATDDALVEWALDQEWIDVVIPFHLVRTGKEVAKYFKYKDYTSESSDTKDDDWTKGDEKYIAPTEHNNDKENYLSALKKNHLKPRFERFVNHPNYMKLVNECRLPASESKPVQPIFNEEASMKALAKLEANGYYQPVGGSVDRMYEIAAEVADKMPEGVEEMRRNIAPTKNRISDDIPTKEYGTHIYSKDIAPVSKMETTTPEVVAEIAPTTEGLPIQQKSLTNKMESLSVEEEKKTKALTRSELHGNIINNVKNTFVSKGFDFDSVLSKAKNLSTFATVDNTPQRVMEKALGYKEGQVLSDLTVNKVAQNESEGIKWLDSFTNRKNGMLKQISKQYNIKPGSKESAAAQMYAEGFYVNDKNEIIKYGDAEIAKDFPDQRVRENIKALAKDERIRQIYDETLARINESRARNLYPEIPRLDNYFLHFRAMDDTFSRLGLPFNPNDIRAKDLPTDLNGVTADLKPGQPYFASAMHRTGKRTSFDLLGGLERYLTSAKNQIYHIDDIQTLRALRNYIADTYGQANGLEGLDALSEEEAQNRIEQVYNSHLSTFAKFLNEEANVLAGKTTLIDRGLEGIIGRRGITFLNTINGQVGSNMVGWNFSSSLTNILPVVQTFAKTNKFDFVKAFAQTAANKIGSLYGKTDGFAEESPVMIRRKGADRFYRTPFQKIGDAGYILMSAVDGFSTELIARTKYNELTRNGMDSKKAHYETDKWVSRLMGDRSLGQMPQLYNSKMLGLFTKFQLEVRNQLDSQFYDTIQETKVSNEHIKNGLAKNARTAAKVTSTIVQLAVAQHLFGKAFESVAGYNPAFDIIEVLLKTIGYDDDEESEDTALDNVEQGFLMLLEDLPYTSTMTGGRIPISSALPIEQLITGKDDYGNDKSRVETLGEIAPYYVLPTGYGQIKKTAQGLKMFDDDLAISGSYTDSGNLRFPVEDTLPNRVQAGLFGQYASENARDYFDNGRKPLQEKQIEEFKEVDIPIRDYWEYREGLSGLNTLSEKADYINSLDLPIDKKNILINNLTERDEPINLTGFDDDYSNFDEFDFAVNNPDKYEIAQKVGGYQAYQKYQEDMKNMKLEEKVEYVAGLDLTTEQKNALINGEVDRKEPIDLTGYDKYGSYEEFKLAKENPKKYSAARVIGYDDYSTYMEKINAIKGDGAKERKRAYIFSLDLDYGQKAILYRSLFDSKADKKEFNEDIVRYLDDRDDVSLEEYKTILEALGMTLHSDGTITW